jgi:ribosome-associated protein
MTRYVGKDRTGKTIRPTAASERKRKTLPSPSRKVQDRKAPPVPGARPTPAEILKIILARLDDQKAFNTVKIDLKGKTTIADFMVVTCGRSNRHVGAIADHLLEELDRHGISGVRVEGQPQCDWVLIDAGDVIVHVFRPEVREFYNLEKMWARPRAVTKS